MAEYVYHRYPNFPSESLSDAVALFVNNKNLCAVGRALGLDSVLRWQPAVL